MGKGKYFQNKESITKGQSIGSVAGTIVGSFFGQPMIGASIGSFVGGVISGFTGKRPEEADHVFEYFPLAKDMYGANVGLLESTLIRLDSTDTHAPNISKNEFGYPVFDKHSVAYLKDHGMPDVISQELLFQLIELPDNALENVKTKTEFKIVLEKQRKISLRKRNMFLGLFIMLGSYFVFPKSKRR